MKSTKALLHEIKQVNEKLEKYGHVNKKALDQFMSFSDRREALLKRKEELDQGEKTIDELITHLNVQKDEAILRTFKGAILCRLFITTNMSHCLQLHSQTADLGGIDSKS